MKNNTLQDKTRFPTKTGRKRSGKCAKTYPFIQTIVTQNTVLQNISL